jgi:hypothetical protein
MLDVDLRQDFKELYSLVVQRVRAFDASSNRGPGEGTRVTRIDFGYQCEQAGWAALVFDTRPEAEIDGHWTYWIGDNSIDRTHWLEAFDSLDRKPVVFWLTEGFTRKVPAHTGREEFVTYLGELLKEVLVKAREDGVFRSLPLAERCEVGVEHFDGGYGWSESVHRGRDTPS